MLLRISLKFAWGSEELLASCNDVLWVEFLWGLVVESNGYESTTYAPTWNRYAAAPQELRIDWAKFTKDYFLNRSSLVSVFLLIDASIPAKPIDLEYASWLGQNQVIYFLWFYWKDLGGFLFFFCFLVGTKCLASPGITMYTLAYYQLHMNCFEYSLTFHQLTLADVWETS